MKRTIALVLAVIILAFSYFLFNLKNNSLSFNPSEDVLSIDDNELFEKLRKSVYQINSANESGTAFVIDIDLINNEVYFLTNFHVVDSRSSSTEQVTLIPTDNQMDQLKGDVIFTGGEIDIAAIKVKVSDATLYTAVSLNKNDNLVKNAKNEYFYTVGYPAVIYRQDKFRFLGIMDDKRFAIDNIIWSYNHFNFNYHTLPGSSGSPIVNYKGELFSVLSTNIGGVGYTSVISAINNMCELRGLTIKICS